MRKSWRRRKRGSDAVENRCYNCRKAREPDRACFSDGECPDFEAGLSTREVNDLLKRMRETMPGMRVEVMPDTGGTDPVIRIERAK